MFKVLNACIYYLKVFPVLFIMVFSPLRLSAQIHDINFVHLTSEDGLSLNGVTNIIQDKKGFLWFGTYNGLNRYDGYNFKIFLPDNSDPKSISNHSVWALHEDSQGYIWIGTLDGLNRYDWRKEEFRKYKYSASDSNSISSNMVYSIYEDESGTIWIGTINGLNKYNRDKDNFTVYKKVSHQVNSDALNSVITISSDNENLLWLGTWNGISCVDKEGRVVKQYFAELWDSKTFDFRKISTIYKDRNGAVWVGTNGQGLKKYNPLKDSFKEYKNSKRNTNSISNDYITVIYQDRSYNLWVGTKNGLNLYDPSSDSFMRIINDPAKPGSIINNEILSIKEDYTGTIWIGSGGGVSRFYNPKNNFSHYIYDRQNPSASLSSSNINSICIDKENNLWVGTFEGLDLIKRKTGEIIRFRHEPGNPNSLSSNYVLTVKEDSHGYIWIGTHNDGVNRYNPATGEFKLYTYDSNDPQSISNKGVLSSCEDHSGNLWFSTWWGFNSFNRKNEKFKRYISYQNDTASFKNNLIWDIIEDSKGMIWIGTDGGGASMLNPKTGVFTNFTNDTIDSDYINGFRVFDIIETRDGLIWFGTTDGLNCYDRKKKKTRVYTTADGLPGLLTGCLVEDKSGNLWIGTDKGLSKFEKSSGTFTNFTKRNGLKDIEFRNNCADIAEDGTLFFGIKNGVIYFHPDSIKDESISAPIVFTDLKIYNQSVKISPDGILKESVTTTRNITIPSSADVITFDFALLNYFDVKRNRFRYKLEGFDKDWNDVGARNSATYTNLPPGEYTFNVKASNNFSRKHENSTSIKLTIVPSFYQSWWFKLCSSSALVLLTFVVIQIRTRRIHKHSKELEQRVAERTKDLQSSLQEKEILLDEKDNLLGEKEILLKEIHHRVKNNLQVISSLLYLNSKKIKDKETLDIFKDSQNRVKSIAFVHERLYQSRDLGKVDFYDYVKRLTNDLFRSYAVNTMFVKLEISIKDIFINLDSAVPCGLIINELISNSLKYAFPCYEEQGKTGLIRVEFRNLENNQLELIIMDNGIGLPDRYNENKINSLGLQLVDSLVAQLEGTLEVENNQGAAFRIKFTPGT